MESGVFCKILGKIHFMKIKYKDSSSHANLVCIIPDTMPGFIRLKVGRIVKSPVSNGKWKFNHIEGGSKLKVPPADGNAGAATESNSIGKSHGAIEVGAHSIQITERFARNNAKTMLAVYFYTGGGDILKLFLFRNECKRVICM